MHLFVVTKVKMSTETLETRRAAFHAHLDECQQCRDNLFDLCVVGAELLRVAATPPDLRAYRTAALPPLGMPRLVRVDTGRVKFEEDVRADD